MSGRRPLAALKKSWRSSGIRLLAALAVTTSLSVLTAAVFANENAIAASDKGAKTPLLAEMGPKPKPVPKPDPKQIDASIRRGVEFLLKHQNANGSWGSERSSRPGEIYAPIPGAHESFRAAVTSLCISAMLEVGGDSPDVRHSVDRAETWLTENIPKVRRNSEDALYNNWAHAYSIDALLHMLRRHAKDHDRCRKIRALIDQQIGMLVRYECIDGGWCYYDDFEYQTKRPSGSTISFVTATVLVILDDARKAGIQVPQKIVDRGVASLLRQRKPDFSYDYGEYLKYVPMMPINRPGGSLGRSQACNLALRAWGDKRVTDTIMETWLDRLFARELWLDLGRKRPIPHESWFQVAGYFFYYGHYYAGRCIEILPPAERPERYDQLAQILLHLQEPDDDLQARLAGVLEDALGLRDGGLRGVGRRVRGRHEHAELPPAPVLGRGGAVRIQDVALVEDRVGDAADGVEGHGRIASPGSAAALGSDPVSARPPSASRASRVESQVGRARLALNADSSSSVSRLQRSHALLGKWMSTRSRQMLTGIRYEASALHGTSSTEKLSPLATKTVPLNSRSSGIVPSSSPCR